MWVIHQFPFDDVIMLAGWMNSRTKTEWDIEDQTKIFELDSPSLWGAIIQLIWLQCHAWVTHYNEVIMSAMTSQITSLTIVYSSVYSGSDQRKDQSSASLAIVRGIHRWQTAINAENVFHLMTSSYCFPLVWVGLKPWRHPHANSLNTRGQIHWVIDDQKLELEHT